MRENFEPTRRGLSWRWAHFYWLCTQSVCSHVNVSTVILIKEQWFKNSALEFNHAGRRIRKKFVIYAGMDHNNNPAHVSAPDISIKLCSFLFSELSFFISPSACIVPFMLQVKCPESMTPFSEVLLLLWSNVWKPLAVLNVEHECAVTLWSCMRWGLSDSLSFSKPCWADAEVTAAGSGSMC